LTENGFTTAKIIEKYSILVYNKEEDRKNYLGGNINGSKSSN